MSVNLNEVPRVKKSILRTGKIVLNSVYPGDSMNSHVTFLLLPGDSMNLRVTFLLLFCVADETCSSCKGYSRKTKDSIFGDPTKKISRLIRDN